MLDQPMNGGESGSMTPPLLQGELEQQPSKWPTVIGVIGVILASLGLLCGCAAYFAVPMQKWGLEAQRNAGQPVALAEAQVKAAEQFQIPTMVLLSLGLIGSIWLLVGSISLLRRTRKARTQLIGWAVFSILLMAINIALQILIFQATVDELNARGESQMVGQLWIGVIIGGCMGFLFGLALQVFVLVWFSRNKIRDEMLQWR